MLFLHPVVALLLLPLPLLAQSLEGNWRLTELYFVDGEGNRVEEGESLDFIVEEGFRLKLSPERTYEAKGPDEQATGRWEAQDGNLVFYRDLGAGETETKSFLFVQLTDRLLVYDEQVVEGEDVFLRYVYQRE